LLGRLVALIVVFAVEVIALSVQFDTSDLPRNLGLTGLVGLCGPAVLQAIVAFAAIFLTFGFITARSTFQRISTELAGIPVSWGLLGGHVCAMLAFVGLSYLLFGQTRAKSQADLIATGWVATGVIAIAFAAIALVPLKLGLELLRNTRGLCVVSSLGAVVACLIGDLGQWLWRPFISITFSTVTALLRPFLPNLTANPAIMAIGSNKFHVIINPACSGFEGVGLMLLFSIGWLWFFRQEWRFPQALLLIPVGVFVMWFLNSIRIAALVLIGNAGAPGIAMGGFHSQAGWIAFNAAALGLCLALRRVPWMTTTALPISTVEDRTAENPTAWYLTPFLMILAAAMVTRATADGFEWLYPLRFFAAGAALFYFRRKYTELDWRSGWAAPAAGAGVFGIWLVLDLMTGTGSESVTRAGLAALSTPARVTWIVFRTLAATITVPIAEELAFRGFLLRRLMSPDFEKVDFRSLSLFSVIVSSVAFGILHGNRWLAGTIAGVVYALTLRHRGRIGDAVVAHGITNALLTAWVLLSGNWQLW
jgi:exosortase E/protease (VPEID-CTERM system)